MLASCKFCAVYVFIKTENFCAVSVPTDLSLGEFEKWALSFVVNSIESVAFA